MKKEVIQEATPKVASPKKINKTKIFYIRNFLSKTITEEILLRKLGYKFLEEVPEGLYSEIKKSLSSLNIRLHHDRRKWEANRGYVYKRIPIYENNRRIF